MNRTGSAFELQTVAHLVQPWGGRARDLLELREGLAAAPSEVLFQHAVQYALRTPGAEELVPDDLSAWVGGVLQDSETAERLSFAVQSHHASSAELREPLLAVLAAVPDSKRTERDAPEGSEFVFLAARSVTFLTGRSIGDAQAAVEALAGDDPSVWFYHLVEEPWVRGEAPLLNWLEAIGEARLASWLRAAANSGLPIGKAQAHLLKRWRRSQIARRMSEASATPEHERREAGRQAVARLLRRRGGTGSTS